MPMVAPFHAPPEKVPPDTVPLSVGEVIVGDAIAGELASARTVPLPLVVYDEPHADPVEYAMPAEGYTMLLVATVLQPKPAPVVQVSALDAAEQDGIASPEGVVAVKAP